VAQTLPESERRKTNTAVHLEQRLDPRIPHPHRDESPEITLDRTKELLARSRATLDAANRRLSHHQEEERLQAPPGSEPPGEPRPR
jgi:hypothetical protein